MNLRHPEIGRLARVDDRGQRFVRNVDELHRVGRGVGIFGSDHGDAITDVPSFVDGQRLADGHFGVRYVPAARQRADAAIDEVFSREHRDHARMRFGFLGVDLLDLRVPVGTPFDGEINHPGQLEIRDVGTLALEESGIFDSFDARTYVTHHRAPFLDFVAGLTLWAATMDFTMFS